MKRFLVFSSCVVFSAVSALASVDSGLIALLPANSKVVAGIDVDKCRNSDFGQFFLSKSQANDPHFDEFMTQSGFDPRRDLDSLVMSSSSDGNEHDSPFVILARGNFDQEKIRSLALSKGALASTYHGVSLLINSHDKDHGQTVAIGFPDTGVAVMGDVGSVHQVIQNLTTAAALDVELTNRIASTGSANDAWVVSVGSGSMLGKQFSAETGGQMNGQAQALRSIRAVSAGVQFGSMVAVSVDATTRSEQDATSLADVFRFGASMVQMQRQSDPKASIVAASLDNMQLSTSGDTVHVGLSMSEKNLEQMASLAPSGKH